MRRRTGTHEAGACYLCGATKQIRVVTVTRRCVDAVACVDRWAERTGLPADARHELVRAEALDSENLSAAATLLEETDAAWREGKAPPIEKIRTLLLAMGRSAVAPEETP